MGKNKKFGKKLKYRFDNFMASGPRSIFMALIVLFFFAFLVTTSLRVGVDIFVNKISPGEIFKTLWINFLQITDPGAIAEDTDNPLLTKVVGILTMFLGLIFFSAVIAFITTQLDEKIAKLKKGRSEIIEKGHHLILGWNDMVIEILRELIEANRSERDAAIAILSEEEKEVMDDYLSEHLPDTATSRIITRTGKISSLESLRRVGTRFAKSVIILPLCTDSDPEDEKQISDARVIKSILAVLAASADHGNIPDIIAEIYDPTKRDVMKTLDPEHITIIESGRMIAKMIVQTSRTSGLASVYTELIGFDGSELYFTEGEWDGVSFSELKYSYSDGIPVGIRTKKGEILVNPDPGIKLGDGDEVIIISSDDSAIRFRPGSVKKGLGLKLAGGKRVKQIEKELIIGWNSKAETIISEYSDYILPGSHIDVMIEKDRVQAIETLKKLKKEYPKINISAFHLDPLEISDLRKAMPQKYDNVIILNEPEEDSEKIDSSTITILLLIKSLFAEIESKTGNTIKTQIISEVMDSENLELVTRTGVNDTIISYQMISKILAQVAENPEVLDVYLILFSEEGSEIYLKPVDFYLKHHEGSVRFLDLMELAEQRGEVLLGYRIDADKNDVEKGLGVIINPSKDLKIEPKPGDCLIVLSEDEL